MPAGIPRRKSRLVEETDQQETGNRKPEMIDMFGETLSDTSGQFPVSGFLFPVDQFRHIAPSDAPCYATGAVRDQRSAISR
jgi:hypothetical protein